MSLKIRLARGGAKKRPYYRIVVADVRCPRDGRFVEKVGTYNPMLTQGHADRLTLNTDRVKYWLSVGAQPTDRVARFLGQTGLTSLPILRESPQQSAPKKKAQERLKAAEEAIVKAKAALEAQKAADIAAKAAAAEAAEAAAQAIADEAAAKAAAAEAVATESVADLPAEEPAATEGTTEAAPEEQAV